MMEWRCFHLASLLQIFLLLPISVHASGDCIPLDDKCSCRYEDTNELITLWDIDNPNDIKFKDKEIKGESATLYYNPCTVFNAGDNGKCDDEIACVKHGEKFYSAGRNHDVETTKEGVIFTYTGLEQDGLTRTTEVTLKCPDNPNSEVHMTEPVQRKGKDPQKDIVFAFNLTTRCACKNTCRLRKEGSGSNMSVGSILLTITFVFLASYFIFGHLFLKYHRNLDGNQAIPNYDFWSELPGYIKDGFAFTKSQLCSGGDPSYDNI